MLSQTAKIRSVKGLVYYAKVATNLISWIHGVDLATKAPNIDWDDIDYMPEDSTAPQAPAQAMAQAS